MSSTPSRSMSSSAARNATSFACWSEMSARRTVTVASRTPARPDSTHCGLIGEQAVVHLEPRPEPVVDQCAAAQLVVDVPVRERAVQQPRVVDRGIADARVAPVDHAGEPAVVDEKVRRPEVGVRERRLEARQCLDLREDGLAPQRRSSTSSNGRTRHGTPPPARDSPRASRAAAPGTRRRRFRAALRETRGRRPGPRRRAASPADQAVGDEPRLARDVLELRHRNREQRCESGEERRPPSRSPRPRGGGAASARPTRRRRRGP